MYSAKDNPNVSQDQVNNLILKANDLKMAAAWELQDICDKNNIKITW
jgi:hypothetical protein